MTTFLIIFAIVLYLNFKKYSFEIANKKFIFYITVLMVVISGLRHEAVGNDTLAYIMAYERYGTESWSALLGNFVDNYLNPMSNAEKDPGFRVFVKILYTIIPDARFLLFVAATIMLGGLGYFNGKNSKSLETTLFSYIFFISLFYSYLPNSAVRQSITVGLCLFGYTYMQEHRYLLCLMMFFLGTIFHKSGLIAILLLPMFYFINSLKFYKYAFVVFALALMFSNQMALVFMDQNAIYDGYLSGDYYGNNNESRPYMIILLFFGLYAISWFGLCKGSKVKSHELKYSGASLALILLPLVWVNPSLIRIVGYFAPFMGIVVAESFEKLQTGSLIRKCVIVIFLLNSLSSIDSFKFMWQHKELHERYSHNFERLKYGQTCICSTMTNFCPKDMDIRCNVESHENNVLPSVML